MFSKNSLLACLTLVLLLCSITNSLASSAKTTTIPHPFFFTENKGQWDSRVLYKCNARNGMTWFLERDGMTLLTMKEDRTKEPATGLSRLPVDPMDRDLPEILRRHPARYPMKSHALKFHFVNVGIQDSGFGIQGKENSDHPPSTIHYPPASARSVEPQGELAWHNNYFLGNDSSKWAPDCRNFSTIVYRDVWEGIDIEWYEKNGKLEFDFVVQPGADPSQIKMSCEGLEGDLSLTPNAQCPVPSAELRLPTSLGELRTALPQVYQVSPGGARSEVDAKFEIVNKNEFGVTLPNGYQKEHTLRIDPLVYSTYLGGSSDDWGMSITNDRDNNPIISGLTYSSNYPVTPGVVSGTLSVGPDGFVTKLNNSASAILFSTYIGGTNFDYITSIVINNSGQIIATGCTASIDFPSSHLFGLRGVVGTFDCFVLKLNSTGSSLLYSTLIASPGDDYAEKVKLDRAGRVYITGETHESRFPTTINAYDTSYNGNVDGFVSCLDSTGSQLLFSTFIGGSAVEYCYGLSIPVNSNCVLISGETLSSNFSVTLGSYDTSYGGNGDAFVAKFDYTLSQLIRCTFLGGSASDISSSITTDSSGNYLVTGYTGSTNFPTTPNAYCRTYNGGNMDCFVTKFDSNLTNILFSTFIGGSSGDFCYSIHSINNNDCIITGTTLSLDFPTVAGSYCRNTFGNSEGFIAELSNNGQALTYSSYIGGSGADFLRSSFYQSPNRIIAVGETNSQNFPVTLGAVDTSYNGSGLNNWGDCFVSCLSLDLDTNSIVSQTEYLPIGFTLEQNFPNPFNSSTTISYDLLKSGNIELKLYDLTGREITTLLNSSQSPGRYRMIFDGRNLASGTYFVRMKAGEFVQTRKMVLLK